jgi:hypothetical protein
MSIKLRVKWRMLGIDIKSEYEFWEYVLRA